MIREPKRDYRRAIILAFLAVICCLLIAGANGSNGTVALDNATGISGNSTPVETTMIVPTEPSGTSPTPSPIPTADFTVPLTSKSVTARSAVQSLDASTSTPTWVQQTAAPGWVSRIYHSSVAMPDDSIVLMGGLERSNLKNDVWRSMDKGVTWTEMTGVAGWSTRWFHHSSVAMSDGTIVLMGGSGFGSTFVNDVWRSTDNGATWTPLPGVPWLARSAHTSVALSDDSIVVMGGASDAPYHDVWLSTDKGATWQQQTANGGWMERFRFAAVVLPDDSIVIMGGATDYGNRNDVWRSTDKGVTWTEMTGVAGWSARQCHSAVALPDGTIILMGGFDDTSAKNDVWRSTDNGATWTQLPDAGWSARGGHTSVSLSDGSIVLIGANSEVWRLPPTSTPPQTGSISISSDPPGATIYLDDVYQGLTPLSLENIPFGVHVLKLTLGNYQDWSDNVELTAGSPTGSFNAVLNQVPPTYSMTRVFLDGADNNTHARYVSDTVHAQYEFENLEKALSEAGWGRPIFNKIGSDVTLEDFGTNGGGLAVTTIHWHNGHGWFDPNNLSESGIELIKNDGSPYGTPYILSPDDVAGKWNMNNKWVVLEACLVLRDPRWNKVLGTTHGIFGFTTGTQTRSTLPTSFFRYSIDEKMPLSMAWQSATQDVFNRVPVPDYLEDPNRNIQMRAGVRFDTEEQYNNDHFPGYGSIAPDGNPQSEHKFLDWPCSKEG